MPIGVKLLVVGASLVGVSCGGYFVYKNVFSSGNAEVSETSNSDEGKRNEGGSSDTQTSIQTAKNTDSTTGST